MERWSGRVALVTGASVGIGAAVAELLVKQGMTVVGCARNVEQIQVLSEKLSGEKGKLYPIRCDVTKEEEILSMFTHIRSQHGGVDVCVNNAGVGHVAPLLSGKTSDWANMLNVNVLGMAVCTREAVKSMRERGVDDGHVIQINSMMGKKVLPAADFHFYTATKFAVSAMAEGLRNELREMNSHIRVSQVSPGLVETEFLKRMLTDEEELNKLTTAYKAIEATDIAQAVLYVLSAPPHVQVHDVQMRPTEQVQP